MFIDEFMVPALFTTVTIEYAVHIKPGYWAIFHLYLARNAFVFTIYTTAEYNVDYVNGIIILNYTKAINII